MKVCTCFLLFTIFAFTSSVAKPRDNQKSISLSLKTIVDFDNYEDARYVKIIQDFMKRLKNALGNNKKRHKHVIRKFRESKTNSFTDFIREAIRILNGYDNEAFEDFFGILNVEIRKYHYRGCKFYELTDNLDTRRLLAAKLDLINGKSITVTKAYINALADILKAEMFDENVKNFIDYINSLYRHDSEHKFQKFLAELEQYRTKSERNTNDLVIIIRDGLRSVIFDHYSDLDTNARRKLKKKIDAFWNQFKETHSSSEETNDDDTSEKNANKSESKSLLGKGDELNKRDPKIKALSSSDDSQSLPEYSTPKPREQKKEESKHKHPKQDHSGSLSSEKIPSSETFESNSIEFSLERQQQYNTQRYVTLYTESIYKNPQNTTKKIKKMKWKKKSLQDSKYRAGQKQKHTTQSTTQFDRHETQLVPVLRMKAEDNDLKQKKQDAQPLKEDNTALKAEGINKKERKRRLDSMEDTDSGSNIASDSAEPTKSRKNPAPTKPVYPPSKHPRILRLQAVFREKPTRSTSDVTRPTTDHQYRDFRKTNSLPLSSNEGLSIEMFKIERDGQKSLRRNANNTLTLNAAELMVINRLNELEKEINEVKHKMENNDDKINLTNVTNKKGKDDIVKLVNGKHDSNKQQYTPKIDKKTDNSTEAKTIKINQKSVTNTSSAEPFKLLKKESSNTITDGRNNILQITTINDLFKTLNVTSNNNKIITKETNNDIKVSTGNIDTVNNVTTIMNAVTVSARTGRVLEYSSPPQYSDIDPFDHKKDGINDRLFDHNGVKSKLEYRRYWNFKG